jgi:hypothetical protein
MSKRKGGWFWLVAMTMLLLGGSFSPGCSILRDRAAEAGAAAAKAGLDAAKDWLAENKGPMTEEMAAKLEVKAAEWHAKAQRAKETGNYMEYLLYTALAGGGIYTAAEGRKWARDRKSVEA